MEMLSVHHAAHHYEKMIPVRKASSQDFPVQALQMQGFFYGAGNEIRTRDTKLGKLVLYQLSYARSGYEYDLRYSFLLVNNNFQIVF